MNNVDRYFSLVKELVGKKLVTEDDSPEDFSMGAPASTGASTSSSTDTSSIDTSSLNSTSSTSTDTDTTDNSDPLDGFDMSSQDLDMPSVGGGLGGIGDIGGGDLEDGEQDMNVVDNSVPKYKVLDVTFDPDDDLNTKVKVQNLDTEEISTVNLMDLNI